MRAINYIFFSAVVLIGIASCKKGATGPTGPKGLTGLNGQNTTYEIVDTTITPAQWSPTGSTPPSYTTQNYPINVNGLDNFTGSLVYVYASLTTAPPPPTYFSLPAPYNGGILTCEYSAYTVYLIYNGAAAPTQNLYVKVVVIPQP